MICIKCQKKVEKQLRIKSPEDGRFYAVNKLCQDCLFKLGEELGSKEPPRYKCARCNQGTYVLRNKECRECYESNKELVATLPECDPIEAPLGHGLIGSTDAQARYEIDRAYSLTPSHSGERPQ